MSTYIFQTHFMKQKLAVSTMIPISLLTLFIIQVNMIQIIFMCAPRL